MAIKIQRRPRKRLRFMQEYKILNEFPHPSLVSVYEFGLLSGGWSYLVLELIDGKSATGHVRSLYGSQRLYKCLQIAIKISEAFGSLHQMNWIHGDIKSNNILVDGNGIPHLIDFQLARAISSTGTGKVLWHSFLRTARATRWIATRCYGRRLCNGRRSPSNDHQQACI